MPTNRPRHFVTETDDLAAALDAAELRWPDLSRGQIVVKLAVEGHHAQQLARSDRSRRKLESLRRHSGLATGLYGPGHLAELHDEWPA